MPTADTKLWLALIFGPLAAQAACLLYGRAHPGPWRRVCASALAPVVVTVVLALMGFELWSEAATDAWQVVAYLLYCVFATLPWLVASRARWILHAVAWLPIMATLLAVALIGSPLMYAASNPLRDGILADGRQCVVREMWATNVLDVIVYRAHPALSPLRRVEFRKQVLRNGDPKSWCE